ncbi:hypothetical protein HAX54_045242 [Datura stramonium]|uniref:ALOG domain-containing protein n=1 Tax=Datura stramonium TaxID=4076 RepID=A0ABS8RH75_DATST|nr:hypothetical protein [Datura stramonium]
MNPSAIVMAKELTAGSSRSGGEQLQNNPAPLSRYESQKRRDWNTFGQYLKNQRPPVALSQCNCNHVLEFLRLDALIGRLRAAYEENGGSPENNPFGNGAIRLYLREVKECQAKARGIPYKKKKKRKLNNNNNSIKSIGAAAAATADQHKNLMQAT